MACRKPSHGQMVPPVPTTGGTTAIIEINLSHDMSHIGHGTDGPTNSVVGPPRSMTRAEWTETYRWKRQVQHQLQKEMDQRLINVIVYGTSHPCLEDDIGQR